MAGVVLALLFWTEPGRRQLVAWSAPRYPAPEEHPDTLHPTFDGPDASRERIEVDLVPVVGGLPQPTDLAPIPGRPGATVVLSKTGTAWIVEGGQARPWFELPVLTTSELGLLGIAFHPRFAENGLFFLDDNPSEGERRTRISRWKVDPTALGEPRLEQVVLEVAQPYQNHDAGQLRFGPDGMLYVGLGDGGFRDDPDGNGQDTTTLLGSMLRLDVDHPTAERGYAVPTDNPFVGREGYRPEIWAYGLRNPWRYAFDPDGRLIVGDVGQNTVEEIDVVGAGENLGWKIREGDRCFEPKQGCRTEGLRDPVWTYLRDEGNSVTGGVVWTAPGALHGAYVFGDFVTGRFWALRIPADGSRAPGVQALGRFAANPTAFMVAEDGTVWVASFQSGVVYAISPRRADPGPPPADAPDASRGAGSSG
ncbi:MAG: PQQ-dependent sugar dehydrogenase [Alphaproteobacteria bacterium]|nr:PQQ-dependent sugar dehydrogenase [Alphaproteobacteria bacterium]MCB9696598.1 PQQ-dependent sugar dehydrogenase [Alphaproteobacteria bacterium]